MRGNWIMMLVAIVAGVVATGLAFVYLQSEGQAARTQQVERRITLLMAKQDLPANHILDPDEDLATVAVPQQTFASFVQMAAKESERESLRGRQITRPIPAGEPILYSHLVSFSELDIGAGMRAMSIPVDRANAMDGILVPGDRIDIVVSYPKPDRNEGAGVRMPAYDPNNPQAAIGAIFGQVMSRSMAPNEWQAEEVVSNVRVLAVGQRLTMSRQQLLFGMETGLDALGGATVLTIEVTRDQGLALISATAGGQNPITIWMRPAPAGSPMQ